MVRRGLTALEHGGVDAATKDLHPDIEWSVIDRDLDVGRITGIEGARRHLQDWLETFDAFTCVPEELIDASETDVVAVVRLAGRAKSSGVAAELRLAIAYTIKDGKVCRIREYSAKTEALEAVGRQESAVSKNLDLVRRQYASLNQTGEPDRSSFAPDAVFDLRFAGFDIQRGLDDFLAVWLPYRRTVEAWRIEIDELLDGHHGVFAAVREGGRMGAGVVSNAVFHVWSIRGGRITAFTSYSERAEALTAAGLGA
jgi:ketosteroid isomerase-like protein